MERSDLLEGLGSGAPLRFRLDDIGTLRRWAHNLHLAGDAIGTGWRDWVLGLSSTRQQRMLEMAGLGTPREYGLVIALIVSAGVVLALLLTALIRTSGPRDPLERIYAGFCRRLSHIGLPRRTSEGPLDFSRRVIAARPDLRSPVESFMALYLPLRYGANGRTETEREIRAWLRRFRPGRFREKPEYGSARK